jgi:hypothetical protein
MSESGLFPSKSKHHGSPTLAGRNSVTLNGVVATADTNDKNIILTVLAPLL